MNLPPGVTANTACIPIDPVHRRPFTVGPGIHLPALPIDVAAADVRTEPTEDTSEQSVNGAHAWVITDSGIIYLVNINPVLRRHSAALAREDYAFSPLANNVTEPEPFVNTLRDRNRDHVLRHAGPVVRTAARRRASQHPGDGPLPGTVLDAGLGPERDRADEALRSDRRLLPAGTHARRIPTTRSTGGR